jgi:LysR family transcriptional regulator, benzoate and cis,cis-muconate-responsive activator of ben and cat genes
MTVELARNRERYMMIERHLPYFAIVAEEQHFQRAADRLGVTQSALSRRIQLLEHELGVKLFERTARGVKLTPAGEIFYGDVCKIRRELGNATNRARSAVRGELGVINFAINPSASSSPLAIRMLQLFRTENSKIDLNMEMSYSEEQVLRLETGSIDVGLLYKFRSAPTLTYTHVSRDRLVLILSRTEPLAEKPRLSVADLENLEFVWPRRSHSPRLSDWMISACNRAGFSPKICMEVESVESVINIIAIGVGAGFAMQYQADGLPPSVVARNVEGLRIEAPLCLAWRSDYRSPILARIVAALDQARVQLGIGSPPVRVDTQAEASTSC